MNLPVRSCLGMNVGVGWGRDAALKCEPMALHMLGQNEAAHTAVSTVGGVSVKLN